MDSMIMKLWQYCSMMRCSSSRGSPSLHYSTLQAEASSRPHAQACCLSEGVRLRVESVVWFLISLLLALFVPVISYIISLTGGLAASFIFLFPGLLLLRLVLGPPARGRPGLGDRELSRCQRTCFVLFGCLIIVLGTFIFGLSIVYTIMHDAKLF